MEEVSITITIDAPVKVKFKPIAEHAGQRYEQEFAKRIIKNIKEANGNGINKKISALNAEK